MEYIEKSFTFVFVPLFLFTLCTTILLFLYLIFLNIYKKDEITTGKYGVKALPKGKKRTKYKILGLSFLLFFASGLSMFTIDIVIAKNSRIEIAKFLDTNKPIKILVDGYSVDDLGIFFEELKNLKRTRAHNSHPLHKKVIEIKGEHETLKLVLAKDSSRPNEYWVYYPKYSVSKVNEVGRIQSDYFENRI